MEEKKKVTELKCASCGKIAPLDEFYPQGHARCPQCGSRGHFIFILT
jgi:DNA-directed RNA polymerase subunit RPC12/RpoP